VTLPYRSPYSYSDYTMMTYRNAATTLWGDAGAYAHDAYTRLRVLYPGLPAELPIVIGITAYGHCLGLTRQTWGHGPRITLFSPIFTAGQRMVDDVMTHEMLHVWLRLQGLESGHDSRAWYTAVRRLSPQVLGHDLAVRRGGDRRSIRVPNPAYEPGNGEPKTLVRKERVHSAIQHEQVAGWPQSFRPADYDWGEPIRCPTY
jgi:hypothetical protein